MPTFRILEGHFSEQAQLPEELRAAVASGGKVVGLQRFSQRHSFVVDDGRGWCARGDTEPTLLRNVETITEVTQENSTHVLRGMGWGILGRLVAGKLGLVAGLFLGGKGNTTVFALKLKDGSEFLCRGFSRDYTRLLTESGVGTGKPT